MSRHLLTLKDYTCEEIMNIIKLALVFKRLRKMGIRTSNVLEGKTVALIFEKPSTRTRASMSVAVHELGGLPILYNRDELQLGRGEPIKDTARVLSLYHDIISARVYSHRTLEELARYSSVPVINMLSDLYHPLQALADYMTIYEVFGKLEGLKLAFIGDGTDNVLNSLMIVGTKLGVEIHVAAPKKYFPLENILRILENRNLVTLTENPVEAVKKADIIYTDVFVSMGQENLRKEKLSALLPKYQVNQALLKHAEKEYIFMHCLPAHREEEVTDEVIEDRKHSVVFKQAENRLHTAKAAIVYVTRPDLGEVSL
ncbi:MAG TPA: ornithine carbamoyltransferase [Thermofilum sp.]|nr:ornithine carbamoyltransferase [Thermofilum sp.]